MMLALLTGCAGTSVRAPVRSPGHAGAAAKDAQLTHVVRRGETLYAIAFSHGLDFRKLAGWNGIADPYLIYPGQRLSLVSRSRPVVGRSAPPASRAREKKSVQKPAQKPASPAPKEAAQPLQGAWIWPTQGQLIADFGQTGRKGIDISGKVGQAVVAANSGKVVYSGGGLKGYGQLIIVKHNDIYLSAYAHNQKLLVAEGERIKQGQRIAAMGRAGNQEAVLHFEVRREGKPVDPLSYLPRHTDRK